MASSEEEEAPHSQVQKFVDPTLLLQSGLARYFNQRLFTDITVVAPDERKILCHQVVLSAGSKRFANMLEQGNLQGEELPVWGVDSDSLEAIIKFFYSGECSLRFPEAIGVLDAAIRLDVPVLAAAADKFTRGCMHPTTATTILGQSAQYKINDLVTACLDYISNNFEAVAATSDFTTGSFQTISRIFSHVADSQPELALFKAAWCWVIADIRHVNYLEALLKIVKVPAISLTELVQLGQQGNSSPSAAAAAVAAAAGEVAPGETPSFSQLQAAAMQIGNKPAPVDTAPAPAGEAEQDQEQQQQQPGWHGVTVTTSSPTKAAAAAAAAAGNSSPAAAGAVDPNAQSTAEALAAAAAAADEGNLLAALAAGGSLMSPAGSSLPGGSLNPALTGAYDSSALATPSSRGPLELMMGHDRAAAAAMGMPHAGRFSSSEVQDYAAAAAAAAAAYASGMHGGMSMGEGMYDDGSGDPRHMMRYNSGSYEEAGMAGGTSSGGRSVSPGAGGRVWTRSARGDGAAAMAVAAAAASVGRSSHAKGVCQVEGCYADLKGLRDYHLRYKICEYHLKVSSIIRDGKPQRFCQQCGRFHLLTDFDGNKRSCRARLQRHNARRRKRGEDDVITYTPSNKRGHGASSGQIGDEMMDMSGISGGARSGDPGAWGPGMANGMDGNMAAYMAAMGGPMGGPGAYGAAGFPGAFPGGPAPDGSFPGHYLGQFGGQFGAMSGMPGMDPASAAAGAAGEGDAPAGPARSGGGYASRRSSARGSRPASALGTRKEPGARPEEETAEGAHQEQGQQEAMREWAAGLEMLADVAQLGNNENQAPGAAAAAAAAKKQKEQSAAAGGQVDAAAAAAAPVPDPAEAAAAAAVPEAAAAKQEAAAGETQQQIAPVEPQQQGQAENAETQQPPEAQQQPPAVQQLQGQQQHLQDQQHQASAGKQPSADGSCPNAGAVVRRSPSPLGVATSGGLFAGRSSPQQDAPPTTVSAEATSAGKEASNAAAQLGGRCDDQTAGTAAGTAAPAVY